MKKHLLFIDTETAGVPKRWDLPYSETNNWTTAIQISWIICDENSNEIKRENFYVYADDVEISSKSYKIHGITKEFLGKNGQSRTSVLEKLSVDIRYYQPLIIGHYTEFDLHTLSCDYYRADLENPFLYSQFFCTMLKSKDYVRNPEVDCFRLPQLHDFLFDEVMERSHNALIDAEMTAKCFFEIKNRGDISEIEFQNMHQKIESKLMFLTDKMK